MDVFGKALEDYYEGAEDSELISYSTLDTREVVPVAYFFRGLNQMPELEKKALQLSKGRILDIGCGVGSHCLELQKAGKQCTGLDSSFKAIEIATARGLEKGHCADISDFRVGDFDTLLLLMNGIGLAGQLKRLPTFLNHLKDLMAEGGQILLDSSDIIYMFESDEDGGVWVPANTSYYGELQYYWEYKGVRGKSFPWLFVDFKTLAREAAEAGLATELVMEGEHYDYLARLWKKT